MYAGDFSTAATFAQALIKDDPKIDVAYLPLAMEALTSGDSARARATYRQAAGAGESGASVSAIGLADVAMYEGRYADAIAALPAAAKRDEDQGNSLGAAAKLVALAEAHAARNEPAPREAAMARARKLSDQDSVLVPAARLAVAAGRLDEARAIATALAGRLPAQSRAYAQTDRGGDCDEPPGNTRRRSTRSMQHRSWLTSGSFALPSGSPTSSAATIQRRLQNSRSAKSAAAKRPRFTSTTFRRFATTRRCPTGSGARVRCRSSTLGRSSRSFCGSARPTPPIRWSRTHAVGSKPPAGSHAAHPQLPSCIVIARFALPNPASRQG